MSDKQRRQPPDQVKKEPSKSAAATMLIVIIAVFVLDFMIYSQHASKASSLSGALGAPTLNTTSTIVQAHQKAPPPGYSTIVSTVYTSTVLPSGQVQCLCLNKSQIAHMLNDSASAEANATFNESHFTAAGEVQQLQFLSDSRMALPQQNSVLAGWSITYESGQGNSIKVVSEHLILTTNPQNISDYLMRNLFPAGMTPLSGLLGSLNYGYINSTREGNYSMMLVGYRYGYAVNVALIMPSNSPNLPSAAAIAEQTNRSFG